MNTSTNVDPSEIAKFEALASRWWDKNSEFKPLHEINPLRSNYIDLRSPVAGKNLLDVGCGGGILCEAMAQRGVLTRPIGNVIPLLPPYCTTQSQLLKMVRSLRESITEVLGGAKA